LYKGIALRSLASAAQLAPQLLRDALATGFATTARAAVGRCAGGEEEGGRECAFRWVGGEDGDGEEEEGPEEGGLQAEMNALSAVMAVLGDEPGRREVGTAATVRAGGDGEGGDGAGSGGEDGGSGDGENAGAAVRVGMGLLLAGLAAAVC
jgi:hypothetical protein